ncbi:cysteine/serine-rich nuclear protein [Acrasis kona]|uniref:Cysteine/serine-rich nuclear protein n=1 Tax=Acrasis kona TaxID=1008807 RepID=A0AAW2ZII9_9EUKA
MSANIPRSPLSNITNTTQRIPISRPNLYVNTLKRSSSSEKGFKCKQYSPYDNKKKANWQCNYCREEFPNKSTAEQHSRIHLHIPRTKSVHNLTNLESKMLSESVKHMNSPALKTPTVLSYESHFDQSVHAPTQTVDAALLSMTTSIQTPPTPSTEFKFKDSSPMSSTTPPTPSSMFSQKVDNASKNSDASIYCKQLIF